MHAYSTSTNERQRVQWLLFGIAMPVAAGLHVAATRTMTWPWWLSFPSMGAVYGLLYFLFDHYAWRWPATRFLFQVHIPVLHGAWQGMVTSASGENSRSTPVRLSIDQRWSAISIKLQSGDSASRSTMAAVGGEQTSSPTLHYTYENEPRETAVDTMQSHPGTARLALDSTGDEEKLSGGYYTGRGRGSTGWVDLRRTGG